MSPGTRAVMRGAQSLATAVRPLAAPWLFLAIRVWLAQAFVVGGVEEMMLGHAAGLRGAGLGPAWTALVTGSTPGMIIQAACPLLLAFGLMTRPAAVALLLQVVLIHLPGVAPDTSLFLAALLGWLIVAGAGPLSLDHLLKRGLDSSAVPAAAAIGRGFARITQDVGPVYLLGLRVWLAAAPAGLALTALHVASGMQRSLAAWLPAVPTMVASLSPWFALVVAGLLAAGLVTRAAALLLLLLVPISSVAATGDVRLYWLLLLAIPVIMGGGPLSLDHWLGRRIGRIAPPSPDPGWPRVVVVGGGFGGVAAVRGLAGTACHVTLIDQRNHTLFQPLLYQVATASLAPGDIATPIRALFRDQSNARVLLDRVSGVDTVGKTVLLGHRRIPYDYLILATGARHSYFGRDDWAPHAPGLKSVEDSTDIRRRLLLAFEEAENAAASDKAAWLTFVIVGGGPTGVELAGAIAELARHGMEQEFRSIDPSSARIILVQSGPRVLPTFPASLSAAAERGLRELGVEIMLDHRVEDISNEAVMVSGRTVAARTVFWAAGVMASPAASWLGVKADRAGRVPVGPDLSVPGCDGVFAIGDTAACLAWNGQPAPGLAPAARQGGLYVAGTIKARTQGRVPRRPFRYRHMGSLATIGRKSAVADFGFIRLRGPLAWWLWGAVHIAFLIGGRNRVSVLIEWLWAYLTFRRGTRLITGLRPGEDACRATADPA